jgi:uncharacterized protein YecE (DUF72 family)
MARLYAGTSGWAYPSWKPDFYPAKLPSKKFLEHYATRLNTVEVNYSFRRLVSQKTQAEWIAATPVDFRFAVKANQRITHVTRLSDTGDPLRTFLGSLQPLHESGKLGPILYQLPPFLRCDTGLLASFLAALPRSLRSSFEFRHESWFTDEVFDLLRAQNVALCVAESEKLVVPEVATADFVYYRLRQPQYSVDQRRDLAARVRSQVGEGKDVFAYFKHEETPEGAFLAEELVQTAASAGGLAGANQGSKQANVR